MTTEQELWHNATLTRVTKQLRQAAETQLYATLRDSRSWLKLTEQGCVAPVFVRPGLQPDFKAVSLGNHYMYTATVPFYDYVAEIKALQPLVDSRLDQLVAQLQPRWEICYGY